MRGRVYGGEDERRRDVQRQTQIRKIVVVRLRDELWLVERMMRGGVLVIDRLVRLMRLEDNFRSSLGDKNGQPFACMAVDFIIPGWDDGWGLRCNYMDEESTPSRRSILEINSGKGTTNLVYQVREKVPPRPILS